MPRPPKPAGTKQDKRNERVVPLTVVDGEQREAPEPPRGIGKKAAKVWRDFFKSPVAQAVDLDADRSRLERWIHDVSEYQTALEIFQKERFTVGSKGQTRLNPIVSYMNELSDRIAKHEAEFGMTPMSRLRLGIAYGQAQLTAQELNRRIEQAALEQGSDDEDIFDDFEEAEAAQ